MTTLSVPEIPRTGTVTLSAAATALIVVDMQNDFAHERGALYGAEARAAIPVIADVVRRARRAGATIVFTQDWHEADDPEFAIWGEHARAGTWGAEIVDELRPEDGDTVVRKLRYDAFYGTDLDHRLRRAEVTHVVVVGTVANVCVLHTAGSAALRHYDVIVVEDAIGALTPFDRLATLRQVTFLYAGRVVSAAGLHFGSAAGEDG